MPLIPHACHSLVLAHTVAGKKRPSALLTTHPPTPLFAQIFSPLSPLCYVQHSLRFFFCVDSLCAREARSFFKFLFIPFLSRGRDEAPPADISNVTPELIMPPPLFPLICAHICSGVPLPNQTTILQTHTISTMATKWLCLAQTLLIAEAAVQIPSWISDNMVLQTNHEYGARAKVNGLADPGEEVTVTYCDVTYHVTADTAGEWVVVLSPCRVDTAGNMTISGAASDTRTLTGILNGDVYFCSGQSNMQFDLQYAVNASLEAASLNDTHLENFRFFNTPMSGTNLGPRFDVNPKGGCTSKPCSQWVTAKEAATTGYVEEFSALCFLTARDVARIHTATRPVGLVGSYYGGTRIEAWMPSEAFDLCPGYPIPEVSGVQNRSALYNDMVYPFRHMAVRAALWYQGERNAKQEQNTTVVSRTEYYACMMKGLITSWREAKQMGDFTFIDFQLSASVASGEKEQILNGTPDVRLGEAMILPHPQGMLDITGMALTYDLCGIRPNGGAFAGAIHPPNKVPAAKRAALQIARVAFSLDERLTNDKADAVPDWQKFTSYWTGPLISEVSPAGASLKVSFVPKTAFGLSVQNVTGVNFNGSVEPCTKCCPGEPPFEVYAGGAWVRVSLSATSVADNGTTVLLSGVPAGVSQVRYAYADYVECKLQNSDGLPLGPFIVNVTSSKAVAGAHKVKGTTGAPPMGYNTWNFYHTNVDENVVKGLVDTMNTNGMKAVGYEYVNIDDGWQIARNATNGIVPDSMRFPSGMKYLADYAHTKGMKFGVYTSSSSETCQSRPGSYGFEALDANTYCDWDLDYIKIDRCGGTSHKVINDSWIPFYQTLAECGAKSGRPVFMSVEYCKDPAVCGQWVKDCADMWRTTADIQATWESVLSNLRGNDVMASVAQPGNFNDPDMLQVGNPGLSYDEQVTHFSLWCAVTAPLLVASDIVHMDPKILAILVNKEAIAVNQDLGTLGEFQGKIVTDTATSLVVVKHLSDGSSAVVFVNPSGQVADVTGTWGELGLSGTYTARDMWAHADVGNFTDSFTAKNVASHGTAFIRFTKV